MTISLREPAALVLLRLHAALSVAATPTLDRLRDRTGRARSHSQASPVSPSDGLGRRSIPDPRSAATPPGETSARRSGVFIAGAAAARAIGGSWTSLVLEVHRLVAEHPASEEWEV
jgi:hypothetical protein